MSGSPITMDLATCVALAFTPLSGAPPSLRSPSCFRGRLLISLAEPVSLGRERIMTAVPHACPTGHWL